MQILLNLAEFGPLSTSVAISANGMVGRRGKAWEARCGGVGWQARRGGRGLGGRAWLVGRQGGAGLGWLGVFGWQARPGGVGTARHGWLAGNCPARTFRAGLISRRGIL